MLYEIRHYEIDDDDMTIDEIRFRSHHRVTCDTFSIAIEMLQKCVRDEMICTMRDVDDNVFLCVQDVDEMMFIMIAIDDYDQRFIVSMHGDQRVATSRRPYDYENAHQTTSRDALTYAIDFMSHHRDDCERVTHHDRVASMLRCMLHQSHDDEKLCDYIDEIVIG